MVDADGDSTGDEDETEDETEEDVTEQFSNMNNNHLKRAKSTNLLLKAILFSCVFYILVHNDTRKLIMKNLTKSIKMFKNSHYEYISVVIFFIVFYIISIFL